jgi:tetratricopeptide (TPR) repeat protein
VRTTNQWVVCVAALATLLPTHTKAESGILVVHVTDIHDRPVAGVSVRAGAGSSVARVDSFGEARIKLAQNAQPGDSVPIELVDSSRDLVVISPLKGWTAVPSFDNKPSNFVTVILVKKGDRALLENKDAAKAMASEIVHESPPGPINAEEALKSVAAKYGRTPEEVDLAIKNWGRSATDLSDKGLSELYAHQYPQAEVDLTESLSNAENAAKTARLKVAETAALLGRAYRIQGKYSAAIEAYEKAVENSPSNGSYRFSLAFARLDNNEPKAAEELGSQALALDKQRFGDKDPELVDTYFKAGSIYVNQDKYEQAYPLFSQALETAEKAEGPDNPLLINLLDNLAIVCSKLDKHAEQESLIKRAQQIQKATLSADDPKIAYTNDKLADFYMMEGKLLDAEALLKESVKLLGAYFEEHADKPLPADFATMVVETDSTFTLNRQLRGFANKDDENLILDRLKFERALTGDDSIQTAQVHERLADLYMAQGRYMEAEKEFRRAIETMKAEVTSSTVELRGKLAYDLAMEGNNDDAEKEATASLSEARSIDKTGPLIISASSRLSDIYANEHKPKEAEQTLIEALSRLPTSEKSGEHVEALNRLIVLWAAEGRFNDAAEKLAEMHSRFQKDGPSIQDVVIEENQGVLRLEQKDCAQATVLLENAYKEAKELKNNAQAYAEQVIAKMVSKDIECKSLEGAETDALLGVELAKQSDGIRKQLQVQARIRLGDVYSKEDKYERAEGAYSESLAIAENAQDVTREDIANILANRAEMYIDWKHYAEAKQSSIDALSIIDDATWETCPVAERPVEIRTRTCRLNSEGETCIQIDERLKRLQAAVKPFPAM